MKKDMTTMRLSKTFTFEAAHHLPGYAGMCAQVHGHTYTLVVTVEGAPDRNGMVIDFSDMKKVVEDTVLSTLDHTNLNDRYAQPTVENVAADIFTTLKKAFTGVNLFSVKLYEGEKNCVEVFS